MRRFLTLMLTLMLLLTGTAFAAENPSYGVTIDDWAGLFSEEDIARMENELVTFTEFGNALVATAAENPFSTVEKLAIDLYDQAFGTEDGAVLLIDMQNREIFWYSEGGIYDKISTTRAMAIVDNIYRFASKGAYADCALGAFSQAEKVLRGGRIAQSMKYYGNALLAFILAIFFNYAIVRKTSFVRTSGERKPKVDFYKKEAIRVEEKKVISSTKNKIQSPKTWGSTYTGSGYSSHHSGGGGYSSHNSGSSSRSSHSSGHSSHSSHSSGGSSHRGGGAGHRF